MEGHGIRGVAVIAVMACALVGGWATARQEGRAPLPADATALDTARLKRDGFVAAPFPANRPQVDHGGFFKRRADGATFTASWHVYMPEVAKAAWDRRRSWMAGDPRTGQRLPSGKPLEGIWMYPGGAENGGEFGIYAIHRGVIVDVSLHYARTPRSQGHRWIVKNPRRDERLVEEITRSLMARLAAVPPMDEVER